MDTLYVIVMMRSTHMNYLITGSSFNLIDREIDAIVKGRPTNRYSLLEVDLKDILEDIGYASLFDEEKIIILKDFESFTVKKDSDGTIKSLENYLASPNEKTTIIFTCKNKVANRGPLKNVISKIKVIETPIISKPYELVKAFGKEVREAGYMMSQPILEAFCEKCAYNYDIALNELKKLSKIKKNNKTITLQDIIENVSNYNMNDSFGFKDAIINLEIEKALCMLDDLESSKMEIVGIIVMLGKEYEAIYNIKLLAEKKMSDANISTEMDNMHPFRVKLLREAGYKYTLEKLEHLILYLCNLNMRLISEDNLGYDELRKFILEL